MNTRSLGALVNVLSQFTLQIVFAIYSPRKLKLCVVLLAAFFISGQSPASLNKEIGYGPASMGAGPSVKLLQLARNPTVQTASLRAQYQGTFAGKHASIELQLHDGVYIGSLNMGDEVCKLSGRYMDETTGDPAVFAQPVIGKAICGRDQFRFEAQLKDLNNISFELEGIHYQLLRTGTAPISRSRPVQALVERKEAPSDTRTRRGPTRLPANFDQLQHGSASGQLLINRQAGTEESAIDLLRNAFDRFAVYFDGPPRLLQAFGDKTGSELQVVFSATMAGEPIQGLALAMLSPSRPLVALAYDQPANFQQSLPGMMRALQAELPVVPVAARPVPVLNETYLPDRSASIGLPDGWRITGGSKGMLEAAGPDGSMVALGIHGSAITPQGVAQYQHYWDSIGLPSPGGGRARGVPVIEYSDPLTTFPFFWEAFPSAISELIGRRMPAHQVLRIVDHSPRPWPNGQAAMIDVEWLLAESNPVHYRSLVLFIMQPGYEGNWTYYFSIVSAPVGRFGQNIPTLVKMWESWQVSSRVYKERLDQALSDMREIGRIIDQTSTTRQASQDAIHADWAEVTRGVTQIGRQETGEIYDAPLIDINRLVENLNESAGYERYEHVPLRELQ